MGWRVSGFEDWMAEAMLSFSLRRSQAQGLIKPRFYEPLYGTPQQIMEELREADPDAHALLSEHLVFEDDGDAA